MLFKDPINQIDFIKYGEYETTKGRHLNLKCDVLENINELIAVYNFNNSDLKLNSSTLANIIFRAYFKQLETKTDQEILTIIKNGLKQELLK